MKSTFSLLLIGFLLFSGFNYGQTNVADTVSKKPVTTMPQYPGGDSALVKFLSANVKYPEKAREKGIEGKVLVWFDISKEGTIENIRVPEPVNKDLDTEAIRVVKLLDDFKPATMNGKPVKMIYKLPITFKLTDSQKEKKKSRKGQLWISN